MKVRILFALMVVALACLVPWQASAKDPYLTQPYKFWVDIPGVGWGTTYLKLIITNSSDIERGFTVTHWYNYTYPDLAKGEESTPEGWITEFTPGQITLPPGGETIINVKVVVPEGTPSGKYITWLKVRDDPVSEERPITVQIRTGVAVPTYEYNMSPCYYFLEINPSLSRPEDSGLKLTIQNTGGGDCSYRLWVANRFNTGNPCIMVEYATDGSIPKTDKDWGVLRDAGLTKTAWRSEDKEKIPTGAATHVLYEYKPIWGLEIADTIEELSGIVAIPKPEIRGSSGIIISGQQVGVLKGGRNDLPFDLVIPKSCPDGYYEARVGVQIADMPITGGTIGIQYECRLFIHVESSKSSSILPSGGILEQLWFWGVVGCAGLLVGMAVVPRVVRKIKRRKFKNGRAGRIPNGVQKTRSA